MSIVDAFNWLVGREQAPPVIQTRSLEQMQVAAFPGRYRTSPWHTASTREAMGSPSVFRAVSLISNTVGTLSLEAYRQSRQLSYLETPRVVVRPNPFTTPQVFLRDTAYFLCRYGEVWQWAARRDFDGLVEAIIPVNPKEVTVEDNSRDPFRPKIMWRGQVMNNDDFRAITFQPDPDNPHRGVGPLQMCGAAVSVSIESQAWAANFFAGGGIPSVLIKAARELDQEMGEADELRDSWVARPNNVPRVIDTRIESVEFPGVNPENAQMTESQLHSVGEVARMFGIPGPLLEYNAAGSSLHYQNDASIWRQFQAGCLTPGYLEPIEQALSDYLTRSTIVRFNLGGLLRSDIATRYGVYAIGIDKGILTPEEARMAEGFESGDIENRPVPQAPPSAIPSVPQLRSLPMPGEVRCQSCNRLLAEMASAPYRFTCSKCKAVTADGAIQERTDLAPLITAIATREPQPPIIFPPGPDMSLVADALLEIRSFMVQERAEREPPVVNVTMPAMTVNPEINVTIPPGEPPVVNVTMPEVNVSPAEVNVSPANVTVPEPMRTRRRVERDDRGLITFVTDEPIREEVG